MCIYNTGNSDLKLGSYGTKPILVFEAEITSWKPGILHITFSSVWQWKQVSVFTYLQNYMIAGEKKKTGLLPFFFCYYSVFIKLQVFGDRVTGINPERPINVGEL